MKFFGILQIQCENWPDYQYLNVLGLISYSSILDLKLLLLAFVWSKKFIINLTTFCTEHIFIAYYRELLLRGLKKKLCYPLLMRFLL